MALSDLTTALQNLDTQIASVTSSPKPNYTLNGKTVGWSEFLANLVKQRGELKRLIQAEQPFLVRTRQNI